MKAALLAAGTLCLGTTAAYAQSSVTLYGIVDSYIGITHATGKGTVISIDSAGYQQSRLGMRIVEDIGAGYHVNAVLENGFSMSQGSAADPTRAFSRQAWVGLSGPFGEVRAGRQNSPQYIMLAQLDAFAGATYGSIINNSSNLGIRYDNSISYISPSAYGLKFQGLVSLGGQASPHTGNNVYVAMVDYARGPWYFGLNYAEQKSQDASFSVKSTFAVADYDYGHGRLYLSWYRGDNPGANPAANVRGIYTSIYSLSGDWRISPALVIGAGEGWIDESGAGVPQAWQASAIATWSLSKRTTLFSSVAYVSNTKGGVFSLGGAGPITRNVPVPGGNETGFQLGIRHMF